MLIQLDLMKYTLKFQYLVVLWLNVGIPMWFTIHCLSIFTWESASKWTVGIKWFLFSSQSFWNRNDPDSANLIQVLSSASSPTYRRKWLFVTFSGFLLFLHGSRSLVWRSCSGFGIGTLTLVDGWMFNLGDERKKNQEKREKWRWN